MKTELSPTWILFASGNSAKIELSLYDPAADRNRPITAYIVSDLGSDVAQSASRAAETIFKIAHTHKLAPPPTVAGFDLQGISCGSQIAGHSSGLALALALAKRLWPENDPGPIAATGEISSSGNGGRIKKISQFTAKARAAIKLLENGGSFFYPAENEAEMTPELRNKLEDKDIKLCPVGYVDDALHISFPKTFTIESKTTPTTKPKTEFAATTAVIPQEKPCRNLGFLLTATCLIALILAGSLYMVRNNPLIKTKTTTEATETPEIPKAPTIVKPSKPLKPTRTAPLPRPAFQVSITGKSNLTRTLAQRTNSRLQASLDSDRKLFHKLQSVNGQIKILSIKERWNEPDNALNVAISATMSGRVRLKDKTQYDFELEPVNSSGPEPVAEQLTKVASLMVEKIRRILQNPPPSGPGSNKSDIPKATPPTPDRKQNQNNSNPNKGFE